MRRHAGPARGHRARRPRAVAASLTFFPTPVQLVPAASLRLDSVPSSGPDMGARPTCALVSPKRHRPSVALTNRARAAESPRSVSGLDHLKPLLTLRFLRPWVRGACLLVDIPARKLVSIEASDGQVTQLGNDLRRRLISSDRSLGQRRFAIDACGNSYANSTPSAQTTYGTGNQLRTQSQTKYLHDDHGHRIEKRVATPPAIDFLLSKTMKAAHAARAQTLCAGV